MYIIFSYVGSNHRLKSILYYDKKGNLQTPFETAERRRLLRRVEESNKKGRYLTIALSGGKTPTLLFTVLADHFAGEEWNATFSWADERMVMFDHPESNFG